MPTCLSAALFPSQSNGHFIKVQDLRYGENSHQSAAWYRDLYPPPARMVTGVQLQGGELSYNNIADADAAWECVKSFAPACVIVKRPCGVAVGTSALEAYSKAFQTDPTSAFGGIIAFNRPVDKARRRRRLRKQFVEVLMAPDFTPEALELQGQGQCAPDEDRLPPGGEHGLGAGPQRHGRQAHRLRPAAADGRQPRAAAADVKVVTVKQPTQEEMQDLLFAWKVAKYVKSNAIVFCKGGMTMGVGAGQMSAWTRRASPASRPGRQFEPAEHRGGERRLLPVPRRAGRGGGRGRPAWPSRAARCATRRSSSRGERAWRGHGLHRRAPLPSLNSVHP